MVFKGRTNTGTSTSGVNVLEEAKCPYTGGFSGKKEEKKIPHKMFPFKGVGGQREEQRHKKQRKEITGKWDNFSKRKEKVFLMSSLCGSSRQPREGGGVGVDNGGLWCVGGGNKWHPFRSLYIRGVVVMGDN